MSEQEVTTVNGAATAAPVATPAPKLNAIQLIEQELGNFFKQKEAAAKQAEQAIANVHAIDGAIQGTQHLLAKLHQAAATAKAEVEKLAGEVETEVKEEVTAVKGKVKKGITLVEDLAKKL